MKKRKIPPLLADLVQTAILSFDNVLFEDPGTCPHCGGDIAGYDIKTKQFAVVREADQERAVRVRVKRFRCRTCGQVCLAAQPFYPGTRVGSPVVDLCLTLGQIMPNSRVSSFLEEMGIVLDRGSVRNYARMNTRNVPAADMFGLRLPLSIITISTLSMRLPDNATMNSRELLEACRIT